MEIAFHEILIKHQRDYWQTQDLYVSACLRLPIRLYTSVKNDSNFVWFVYIGECLVGDAVGYSTGRLPVCLIQLCCATLSIDLTQINLFCNNKYLLNVSAKDTGAGANTYSIHLYWRIRAYMHLLKIQNKEMKISAKTLLLFHCFMSLSLRKHVFTKFKRASMFLLKMVMFWHNNFASNYMLVIINCSFYWLLLLLDNRLT